MRSEIHIGSIKFFDSQKNNFGFVSKVKSMNYEYNEDIFVSENAIKCDSANLQEGQLVYFKVKKSSKGYKAVDLDLWENLGSGKKVKFQSLLPIEKKGLLAKIIIDDSIDLSSDIRKSLVDDYRKKLPSRNPYLYKFLLKFGNEETKDEVFDYLNSFLPLDKYNILVELSKMDKSVREYFLEKFTLGLNDFNKKYSLVLLDGEFYEKYLKKLLNKGLITDNFPNQLLLQFINKSNDEENLVKLLGTNNFLRNFINYVIQKIFIDRAFSYSFFKKIICHEAIKSIDAKLQLVEGLLEKNLFDKDDLVETFVKNAMTCLNFDGFRVSKTSRNSVEKISRLSNSSKIKTRLKDEFQGSLLIKFKDWDIEERIKLILYVAEDSWKLKLDDAIRDEEELVLWIEGYKNFDKSKLKSSLVYKLPYQYQQFLIKKIFYKYSKSQIQKPLAFLNELLKFSSEKNYNLDFSTEIVIICLKVIDEGGKNFERKLYKILFEKLDMLDPNDQNSMGYFDHCPGRAILKPNNKEEYEVKRLNKRPCEFCEGSLFVDFKTNKPIKDDGSGKRFWWCHNSRCMQANRNSVESENWKNYTLMTFSKLLDLNFDDKSYANLLGVLNRLKKLLPHLYCSECGMGLAPYQSYYGYYRSSKFKCCNESCKVSQNDDLIYLTHCINSKCSEIIDSRESSKCNHNGYAKTHGWYVCNNCLACCTTEKIENRIKLYLKSNRKYYGPSQGHKDQGIICCNECGEHMHYKNRQYKKALDRLVEIKDSNRIIKHGQRNDGGWWFLIQKIATEDQENFENKINRLNDMGLEVPDLYDSRGIYFVAEPYEDIRTILICSNENCSNSLDLTALYEENNFERIKALQWHKKIKNQ